MGRGGQARSFNYLGPIGLGNGPYVLGNGPEVLGNGNGPHLLCTVLCRIRYYVAFGVMSFGIMLHSALCRIRHYVAFCLMSFGIVLFSVMSLG